MEFDLNSDDSFSTEVLGEQYNEGNTERKRYNKIEKGVKKVFIDLVLVDGHTIRQAAKLCRINESTGRTIIEMVRKHGSLVVKKRGGNNKTKLNDSILRKIETIVEDQNQITLKEIKRVLSEDGIFLAVTTINKALQLLKITCKRTTKVLEKVNDPISIQKRMSYAIDFSRNAPASKEKCIFIDECGYNLHLRKTIARSKKGSRAIVEVPTVRGRNVTVIAAMNSRKIIHYSIIDNSTCNSEKFGNFLRELVVVLQGDRVYDDSWLIMDNAQIHKTELISGIVFGTTYKIKFLSPYSYMLNPIENAWSKMKSVAKNLLALTNNENSLRNIIIEGIASIEQQDCFNYIIHMMNNITKAVAGEEFWF